MHLQASDEGEETASKEDSITYRGGGVRYYPSLPVQARSARCNVTTPHPSETRIAYFSMEIGLDAAMPTYSGGLGILAGDTLRAAADLGLPLVAITLLHRKGYFRQRLDIRGQQSDSAVAWSPQAFLEEMPQRAAVYLEGRRVEIRAWRLLVEGVTGKKVPVYFLDTSVPENTLWDQGITDTLYGGDGHYRLCQEAVLGMGGVAMLRAMGYHRVQTYHMNDGHPALLTLALLIERAGGRPLDTLTPEQADAVRQQCVFTTHTPVQAGHDRFPMEQVAAVLGHDRVQPLTVYDCCEDGWLDMTYLAMSFSRCINAVAMRHRVTTKVMYPNYQIAAVTNGVHATTWTCRPFQELYDRHIPEWRRDNAYFRYATGIPLDQIQGAHARAKRLLVTEVERRTEARLDPNVFTIAFARRATPYKRHDLLFNDLNRLRRIVSEVGPVQVVYSGKAHPYDEGGKALIRRVFEAAAALRDTVKVVYLEEYDMALGGLLTSGADLWLNNPQKPLEASGTSGMKAAFNGVPSLSVLDGWWIEGHLEGVTGWAIGDAGDTPPNAEAEAHSLYDKLEYAILPAYYGRPSAYAKVMRSAIAFNGSFFNTHRMVREYAAIAYNLAAV